MQPKEIIISISSIQQNDPILENLLLELDYSIPIKIFTTPEKKYAGENRNIAAEHAQTEILTFIDADDLMHRSKIEVVQNAFQFPQCQVLFHHFKENQVPSKGDIIKFNEYDFRQYWFSEQIHFGHITVSKFIWEQLKYSDLPRGQDIEFAQRILLNFRKNMFVYHQALTYYISNNSSYWNKNIRQIHTQY